ncbi:hypothetical protein C0583_01840 [Candidatus Parcubacteria bacterium]|nr:MAG: hypothetical protein C0583_01840 [Candidatus Parcubacteria bacterium]
MSEMYNVALRYTIKAGGYHGIITWTSFESKEDFDKFYTEKIRENQEVVEEGISEERCMDLTATTPLACRIAAAHEEANSSGGEISKFILEAEMQKAVFAHTQDRKRLGIK